jgi:Ca-activated chloride channel family protein
MPSTPPEPGSEAETVEEFDQLGEQPEEDAQERNPDAMADARGEPGPAFGMPLMEQWLEQVEGDPSYLLRNQFMLEESRTMQSLRGMMVETRPW